MIFNQVVLYQSLGGTHITLWPMFIAAVEAYEPAHLVILRAWLGAEDQIGVANRRDFRIFMERVWSLREETAETLGVDKAAVCIDWVAMMQE